MILRGRRVVTPEGVRAASVHVTGGRIERISDWSDIPGNADVVDAGSAVVMPGLVDTHVHVNEPGRTEWEGFETATRAAAAGGITTILDMPLNSIPATTTVAALEAKRRSASGKTVVNVEFIGGVVPGNAHEVEPLARAGVRAFKCFLTPSGVEEFPNVSEEDLREAFPLLARTGLPLMVHAEDPACIRAGDASSSYSDYLATRPVKAETSAIELIVRLMRETPTRVHIVHLSSAQSLDIVRAAKVEGLPITVETCPHYLAFAAEDIPDGATEYKCAPPIRSRQEQNDLWTALIDGDIDLIASDHSPCPPAMKETGGDFMASWGGIASLQLALPVVWTHARERGVGPEAMAHWMSEKTAQLAGLADRKGRLGAGFDADIVIWDPDATFTVDASTLLHRHPVSPYDGMSLHGRVIATYVGGALVTHTNPGESIGRVH
jgi:allantoinase